MLEAEIELGTGADPAAPGALVTIELCGRVDHPPPCDLPHHSRLDPGTPAVLRTVYLAAAEDAGALFIRIDDALRSDLRWRVIHTRARPLTDSERSLAERLALSAVPDTVRSTP